jgi:hypothetical protein
MMFTTKKIRWLAYLLALFTAPLLFLSLKDGSTIHTMVFTAIFGFPIAFLYFYSADVCLCEEKIKVRFTFGNYEITWSEVEFYSRGGGNIKFLGGGKTLTFPSMEFWHGHDLIEAINFLNTQAMRHGHKEKPGYLALIPTFHGTRKA